MSKKKKTVEPVHSTYELSNGSELTFITSRDKTFCVSEPINYDKIVARHAGCKDLEAKHKSLKHLFQQYIDDAKRILEQ